MALPDHRSPPIPTVNKQPIASTDLTNLGEYLADHFAGSVGAIALLEDLGSSEAKPGMRELCTHLKVEIQKDQAALDRLMGLVGARPNLAQQGGAWLLEKATALRLGSFGSPGNDLGLMEAFELLALGIEGKRLLWRALGYTLSSEAKFQEFDFAGLAGRAAEQFSIVEKWRIEMARSAFAVQA